MYHLNTLVISLTEDCNMRCKYCDAIKQKIYTSRSTIANAIKWFFKEYPPKGRATVVFFGGEPLLAYDNIMWTLEKIEKYNQAKPKYGLYSHGKVYAQIITNGLAATKDIADGLNKFSHIIDGIRFSVDGSTPESNQGRFDDINTFNTIMENIKYMINNTKLDVVVGIVVNQHNYYNFADSVIDFYKMGVRTVDWTPEKSKQIIDLNLWHQPDVLAAYKSQLLKINDFVNNYMNEKKWENVSLVNLKFHEAAHIGLCDACTSVIEVVTNGDIFPCSRFSECERKEYWKLGNVNNGGITNKDGMERLRKLDVQKYEKRAGKKIEVTGICPAFNEQIHNDYEYPDLIIDEIWKINRELYGQNCSW